MAEQPENNSPKKRKTRPNKDIGPILDGWEYEPGTINVRKILGADGLPKLQMRLDLGLLQMELRGRPDGARPHGHESLLEYYEDRLKDHNTKNGTELGFHLTPAQCQSLREEALMYYHRYLGLFVLGDFAAVARDTNRNLRVLDMCVRFGEEEQDRLVLEQYRPYIVMMNTRALASIQCKRENYRKAMSIVRKGLLEIRTFFERFGKPEVYRKSNEARILKRLGREIREHLPVDVMKTLNKQLGKAIQAEHYEEAARLRDEIARLTSGGEPRA